MHTDSPRLAADVPTRRARTAARRPAVARALGLLLLVALSTTPVAAQQHVDYRVSFPSPEHHWAQVEVTFAGVKTSRLEARMSRSSPGRYALHEYAKNVFDVQAFDGKGQRLKTSRPNPYQWDVSGHDGTVRMLYKVYGDQVDGTYLAIDPTHAHMNMPATLMWGRGFERVAINIRFEPPPGLGWIPATQLFPTDEPWTFTAPNLQYLMDSPTELSAQSMRSFGVRNPDGKELTIRIAVHHDASDAEVDEYAAGVEKIVREMVGVYGEYPVFETGTYTFLADYLPWGGGDGMEHRNSTVVAARTSLRGGASRVLGTVSHEFFHAWNVERIRPASLEPFNFEEANMSGELWLAEGFTSYYGGLVMHRAGLTPTEVAVADMARASATLINPTGGRQFRSAVEMSQMAPFTDAARSVDRTNQDVTFISYYTYGQAIAVALDLTLRGRSGSKVSLDHYMRRMWEVHGKPGGPQPGLVAKPYTLSDARDRLAEVSGDRAFAADFFARFIEGREAPDYAALFAQAGFVFRKRSPGLAWVGQLQLGATGTVDALVPWGTPAHDAGIDQGDTVVALDGRPLTDTGLQAVLKAHKPGDRIAVEVRRRNGVTINTSITVGESPALEVVSVESTGGTLTAEQKAFRAAWLGPTRKR